MSKTKSDVLSSAYDLKETVDFPDHDWYPEVRPLTDSEFAKAQSMLLDGQQFIASREDLEGEGGDVNMNLGGLIQSEFSARVYIVATGMIENWSENEVRRIPYNGSIEIISNKILELGEHDLYAGLKKGVSQKVERFRNQRGGAADNRSAPGGSSSSRNSEGDDLHTESVPVDGSRRSVQASGG